MWDTCDGCNSETISLSLFFLDSVWWEVLWYWWGHLLIQTNIWCSETQAQHNQGAFSCGSCHLTQTGQWESYLGTCAMQANWTWPQDWQVSQLTKWFWPYPWHWRGWYWSTPCVVVVEGISLFGIFTHFLVNLTSGFLFLHTLLKENEFKYPVMELLAWD